MQGAAPLDGVLGRSPSPPFPSLPPEAARQMKKNKARLIQVERHNRLQGGKMKDINAKTLSNYLREHLRGTDHFQNELAEKLSLHPKVLSRKLNGYENAHLTTQEVWKIIETLVQWKAVTVQDEVLEFLSLVQVEPATFSIQQWQTLSINNDASRDVKQSNLTDALALLPLQHHVPTSLTPLTGREAVIAQLRELVGDAEVHLVTLSGPGGSGKTRLAQQLASDLKDAFADGVWFVPLAPIAEALLVPTSILQALHIRPALALSSVQNLIAYLQNKHLLLILDNFEHVGDAAPIVSELLAAAPGLRVLVTSRKVLHLYGENVFNVPSLDYPDAHSELDTDELSQYSAIQLFVERARASVSGFALTSENAASIAQICARIDGLPLAIELAAARVKVLPPDQLLARLEETRLSLLTGGARDLPDRQQTLRNTIKWSYDLLSPVEQVWFARLGIFSGGCSLEAIEAMMRELGNGDEPVPQADSNAVNFPLDLLVHLIDNNLLVQLPAIGLQVRYTLLETLRAYALEQLQARGEYERLQDWHACYYLRVAETAELELRGSQQIMWRTRLVEDRDNFRAALLSSLYCAKAGASMVIGNFKQLNNELLGEVQETSVTAGQETPSSATELLALDVALRLASALRPYWEWHGYINEGRQWLNAALEIEVADSKVTDGTGKTTLAARAKALSEVSRIASLQNELDKAVELAEASLLLWRQLDNPEGLVSALLHRGWAAIALGENQQAKSCFEDGLQLLTPTGNVWLRAQMFFYLGAVAGFNYDFDQMRTFYAQSRTLFEQVGDKSAIADVLKDQGGILILEGNFSQAIDNLLRSLALSFEIGQKQFIAMGTGLLAYAVGARAEPDPETATLQAALIWGASEALREAIGAETWLGTFPAAQIIKQQVLSRVEESSWCSAWQSGRELTEEQIVTASMALQGTRTAVNEE